MTSRTEPVNKRSFDQILSGETGPIQEQNNPQLIDKACEIISSSFQSWHLGSTSLPTVSIGLPQEAPNISAPFRQVFPQPQSQVAFDVEQIRLQIEENSLSLLQLGKEYFANGEYKEAIEVLQRGFENIQLAPECRASDDTNISLCILLGQAFQRNQQLDQAINVFNEGRKNCPKAKELLKASVYASLANVLHHARHFDYAILAYLKALTFDCELELQASWWLGLATVYKDAGKIESACTLMQGAINTSGISEDIKQKMEELLSELLTLQDITPKLLRQRRI